MHYYEPTPILLDGTCQLVDAGVLLVVSAVLPVVSQLVFQRRDI